MLLSASVLVLTSAAVLLSDGCAAPGASSTPSGPADPTVTAVQSPFTRILNQNTSGYAEPAEVVIRDRAGLDAAWSTLFQGIPGNPPPAVDFAREMVILIALGERRSGGFTVRVDELVAQAGGVVVRYAASSPGRECMSTQMLTSPVEVVRSPRAAGAVRFERRDVVAEC